MKKMQEICGKQTQRRHEEDAGDMREADSVGDMKKMLEIWGK